MLPAYKITVAIPRNMHCNVLNVCKSLLICSCSLTGLVCIGIAHTSSIMNLHRQFGASGHYRKQNRRQKVFNRGLYVCSGGRYILKFYKNSINWYCFMIQFGWVGALFGGLSPKTPSMATGLIKSMFRGLAYVNLLVLLTTTAVWLNFKQDPSNYWCVSC